MKPEHDEELESLARALRASTHGKASQPDTTRAAVLRRQTPRRADRSVWLAAAAALLGLILVPSAWALYSGYLVPSAPPGVLPVTPATPPEPRSVPVREAPTTEVIETAPTPVTQDVSEVTEPVQRRSPPRMRPTSPAEREAYEAAHALHFEQHDAHGALDAWEAYLSRYPQGRFAPEAHYNRALTLVRLGRREEAIDALRPFENGAFGAYRQHEASELRAALGEAP